MQSWLQCFVCYPLNSLHRKINNWPVGRLIKEHYNCARQSRCKRIVYVQTVVETQSCSHKPNLCAVSELDMFFAASGSDEGNDVAAKRCSVVKIYSVFICPCSIKGRTRRLLVDLLTHDTPFPYELP